MKSLFTILVAVILFAVYFLNREREKTRKLQLRRGFRPDWTRTGRGPRRRRPIRRGGELRPDWSRVRRRPGPPEPPPSRPGADGAPPASGGPPSSEGEG